MIDIAPSLLAANSLRIGAETEQALRAGARLLHIDVMDGLFVPNFAFGTDAIRELRPLADHYQAKLAIHLMIVRPERQIAMFRDCGSDSISIHEEAGPHAHRTLGEIRRLGMRAGLTVNPGTSLSTVEELLGVCDEVLVMGVDPGFGGQSFIPETVDKVRRLKEMAEARRLPFRIAVDGGVTLETIGLIAEAGADVAIAGSAVFRSAEGIEASLGALRNAALRPPVSPQEYSDPRLPKTRPHHLMRR